MRHTVWDLSFWKRHVCAHCIHTPCFFFRHFTLCIQTRVAAHIQCIEAKLCSLSHQSANGYCKESKHNQRRMSGRERLKKEEKKKHTRLDNFHWIRAHTKWARAISTYTALGFRHWISNIKMHNFVHRKQPILRYLFGWKNHKHLLLFFLVLHFALPNMFCVAISSTANHSA